MAKLKRWHSYEEDVCDHKEYFQYMDLESWEQDIVNLPVQNEYTTEEMVTMIQVRRKEVCRCPL